MKEEKRDEPVLKDNPVKNVSEKHDRVMNVARGIWGESPEPVKNGALRHEDGREKIDSLDHPDERHRDEDRLAQARDKINQLNNKLHEPDGPLAASALELIGFDKGGRLLLIDRDQQGKVDNKYLVEQESGKIVARTQAGHLDKWEHGSS